MSLNKEDFDHSIYKLYPQDQDPEPREWVMHTGSGGMNLFNEAMKREIRLRNANYNIELMKIKREITDQELENLKRMINSTDTENLTVAEAIIEEYERRRISVPALSPNT